jgi:hypothetical protein
VSQQDDLAHPQSLVFVPRNGKRIIVAGALLNMSETVASTLTNKMNTHAREWVTRLLLPRVFALSNLQG